MTFKEFFSFSEPREGEGENEEPTQLSTDTQRGESCIFYDTFLCIFLGHLEKRAVEGTSVGVAHRGKRRGETGVSCRVTERMRWDEIVVSELMRAKKLTFRLGWIREKTILFLCFKWKKGERVFLLAFNLLSDWDRKGRRTSFLPHFCTCFVVSLVRERIVPVITGLLVTTGGEKQQQQQQ